MCHLLSNVRRAENWQKHFHDELEARREDWPTVQSILDSEEQQRREAEEDDLSIATVKSRKRKAAAALAATDDSHNPVYSMHYHSLSPEVKAALLYLNTCWMLHDHNIHAMIAESQLRDTPASAYGQDDADRQYWLFTHCDWGEKRVHLYRETDAHNEQEYRWEVLASNRDQLEEALAVLMVQTSANSRTLVYRIQYEALEYMGHNQHNSSTRTTSLCITVASYRWHAYRVLSLLCSSLYQTVRADWQRGDRGALLVTISTCTTS